MTSNFPPRNFLFPRRNGNICPPKNLYMNVHGDIIHNRQRVDTPQRAII